MIPKKSRIRYCIDCGKKLNRIAYWFKTLRCKSCAQTKRMKDPMNTPRYIDGRCLKIYHCKDCGKEIGYKIFLYCTGLCKSCVKKGILSYNWNGGTSFEQYPSEFNNRLRKEIKTRDQNKCQVCNMSEEEHIEKYNRKLEIHHIDYNRKNCLSENLITVCKQDNINANYDKDYYYAYFTYIMEQVYE